MIFAVFDPSPLTVRINRSFLHLYSAITRRLQRRWKHFAALEMRLRFNIEIKQ